MNMLQIICFHAIKGFVAQVVFHLAGVLQGSFFTYAQRHEDSGYDAVPFQSGFSYLAAFFGEVNMTIAADFHQALLHILLHVLADGRLGKAQVICNIHGPHRIQMFAENKNCFHIVFCGFRDAHDVPPECVFTYHTIKTGGLQSF